MRVEVVEVEEGPTRDSTCSCKHWHTKDVEVEQRKVFERFVISTSRGTMQQWLFGYVPSVNVCSLVVSLHVTCQCDLPAALMYRLC